MKLTRVAGACALMFGLAVAAQQGRAAVDPELLAGMKARSVGPAGMSGRIAAIEAVPSDPDTVYVGAATGGVWKSVNGGLTWKPIFDDQPVAAIGAIAITPTNPDVVWVGTGEGNTRNSVSVGNGLYRSLDAGESWTHVGLDDTERIHRIIVHPRDPNVVWVAALGRLWGENPERGVFKTTDGGATWERVLYVDERSGAADLVMDPSNPDKLIAAMWDYRRWPWFFRSGGPGSGLHVTLDGGKTWKRLTERDGMPPGELGRIGVAFCRNFPNVVYALVEAESSALIRSDDGGTSWITVNQDARVAPRPFYFADIRVDPEWPQRVYSLWSLMSVSDDGGKSFRVLAQFRDVHPDHHALWINPENPRHLIAGNDGGVAISADRGETWKFVSNLPVSQFYHVAVDDDTPYHIYGGMQDNGSWRGPSTVWENGGIRNYHWKEVDFGDGFDTLPDPRDSTTGYSMSQEGYLRRWNLRTGVKNDIRPAPQSDDVELRFNWNSGLAIDPFDPDTIYYGSQFVHRSTDRGDSWTVISPDLTANDPGKQNQAESGGLTPDVTGAENFTTIIAIAPSPIERGVLWVGTDDGRIHVTRDAGESWTSVEGNLKGVPEGTWVPHIEPSRHDPATAFVVLDNHRRSDWKPYVYRTKSFGKSWTSLVTPKLRGYALTIAEDPVDPDLLFVGTEFGLFASIDGGSSWLVWNHGVPTVSVMDLAIQARRGDLVLGTHGRGAYVLDDISPLRTVNESVLGQPIHLFEIPDAQQHWIRQTAAPRFPGHGEFRGAVRPYGAMVTVSLSGEDLPTADDLEELQDKKRRDRSASARKMTRPEDPGPAADESNIPEASITVLDEDGETVRTFRAPVHRGVNRVVWNLRSDPFREPPRERPWWRDEPAGPQVLPGTYTVEVSFGEHDATGTVRVVPDPRMEIPADDRAAKWDAIARAGRLKEVVAEAVSRIIEVRADAEVVTRKIEADAKATDTESDDDNGPHTELVEAIENLNEGLDEVERKLWVPPETKGIVAEKDCFSKINYAMGSLKTSWDKPTTTQVEYLDLARAQLDAVLAELNEFFAGPVAQFRERVAASGFELVPEGPPLAVE